MSYWGRYVPVAERRANAARKVAKLRKTGHEVKPVEISGRKIAKSFWGSAWCKNLESYSDYASRLPRGRTYARNGSVVDLQIEAGRVEALVSGSRLYDVKIDIKPLQAERWTELRGACAGEIDSLVELLAGKVSSGVMSIVSDRSTGLFPAPAEIGLKCSCPDWATMCKHVAASLYGVGARLDHEPELLFTLRGVDPAEMVTVAIEQGVTQRRAKGRGRVIATDDIAGVFGVDIDFGDSDPSTSAPASHAPASEAPASQEPDLQGLPPSAVQVFQLISEQSGLRAPDLARQLTLAASTVRSAVSKLKKRELISFEGPPRSGGYYRVEEP